MKLSENSSSSEASKGYSWVGFMEEFNQNIFNFIDNICSQHKGINTMDFLFELKSNIELRKFFGGKYSLSEDHFEIFFDDVFFPKQQSIENIKIDIRKTIHEFLDFRTDDNILTQLKNIIYFDDTADNITLEYFEGFCFIYNVSLIELLDCLKKIDLNGKRKKNRLQFLIKSKNAHDVRKYTADSFPDLDRELCKLNLK